MIFDEPIHAGTKCAAFDSIHQTGTADAREPHRLKVTLYSKSRVFSYYLLYLIPRVSSGRSNKLFHHSDSTMPLFFAYTSVSKNSLGALDRRASLGKLRPRRKRRPQGVLCSPLIFRQIQVSHSHVSITGNALFDRKSLVVNISRFRGRLHPNRPFAYALRFVPIGFPPPRGLCIC